MAADKGDGLLYAFMAHVIECWNLFKKKETSVFVLGWPRDKERSTREGRRPSLSYPFFRLEEAISSKSISRAACGRITQCGGDSFSQLNSYASHLLALQRLYFHSGPVGEHKAQLDLAAPDDKKLSPETGTISTYLFFTELDSICGR